MKDGLDLVLKSIQLAMKAHKNQFRKDGKTPYLEHVFAVAYTVDPQTPENISAALLHDVLEMSCTTSQQIHDIGVPPDVMDAIQLLTRADVSKTYLDYIRKLKEHPIAKAVKIADINHNISDDPSPTAKSRYRAALEILNEE